MKVFTAHKFIQYCYLILIKGLVRIVKIMLPSIIIPIREKAFREMKKDVGMTTAQKSKETRRMESLFCISSQQSLHIRRVASDYSVVMYVYVGIVGWIYKTKIPSFLFPYFFEQWSSLHLFSFHEMLFPLLVPGLFSSLLWF